MGQLNALDLIVIIPDVVAFARFVIPLELLDILGPQFLDSRHGSIREDL